MIESEFQNGLAMLIAGVGKTMPPEQVDVWREMVSDMTFEQFKRGIVACLRDYKYAGFPPVGLIRQAAGISGGVIDSDAAAMVAWQTVLKAIREIGGYRSVCWSDAVIATTIESIGESWAALCEKPSAELHSWTKKAFIESYRVNRAAGVDRGGASAGLIAKDAGRFGFDAPEPVHLGETPQRVYGFGTDPELMPAMPAPAEQVRRITQRQASLSMPGDLTEAVAENFGMISEEDADPEVEAEDVEGRRQRSIAAVRRMITGRQSG